MSALDKLVEVVKNFEGCRLTAYRDIVGILTIGHGETEGVTEGMVWTQQQADDALRRRLASFMSAVLRKCPQLHFESEDRLVACVSLAYNIGAGAFGASSVCRKTIRKEYQSAADSFLLWNKAGGRVIRGLTLRRVAERRMYLSTASS